MPISRRRRANPPEQPENNNHLADQLENATEAFSAEQPTESSQGVEKQGQHQVVQNQSGQPTPGVTPQASFHSFAPGQSSPASSTIPGSQSSQVPPFSSVSQGSSVNQIPQTPVVNGDRIERQGQDYTSAAASMSGLEGGRRTARGELFRRPPQPPAAQPVAASVGSASLQAPVREISLPLGNLLHLAYNPGYTGSDEARTALLEHLERESKAGGRARCWSCGSLGIVYDRWDIRSKAFSEVGIAFCEICGVWSVM